MCRQKIESTMSFSDAIVIESEYCETLLRGHQLCPYVNLSDAYLEYLADLNGLWLGLVNFLNETRHLGIKGIEHLSLDRYKNNGRLLEEGERHVVLKTEAGKIQLVFSCLLPNMSLRFVAMLNSEDDIDICANNEYADEVMDYITTQLRQCWRIFPRLMSRYHDKNISERIFVRKFKNVTCYFLASGIHEGMLDGNHYESMKQQLCKAKKCNFDEKHYDRIRLIFPAIQLVQLQTHSKYRDLGECCYAIESDDDDYYEDEEEDLSEGEESNDERNTGQMDGENQVANENN